MRYPVYAWIAPHLLIHTEVEAAEQRHELYQAASDGTAMEATKSCGTRGCTYNATLPTFTSRIAQKLTPSIPQWPPRFGTLHCLRPVLKDLYRLGVVEIEGLKFPRPHSSWSYPVSLRQIALGISQRAKGLCLHCARGNFALRDCEHTLLHGRVLTFDPIV